jgi:DHA3 family macrolide efflux protein-like MFS transporter
VTHEDTDRLSSQWIRPFFFIWGGQAFSILGSNLVQFAMVWWLTQTTGSAAVLATGTLVAFLPEVALAPFAGALVDRWNRRVVMIVADASMAVVTFGLAIAFFLGHGAIWQVYVIMFLRSAATIFHWASLQASIAMMVPDSQLARVAGVNEALRGALRIISPPLAALLLGLLPIYFILSIDMLTALLAVLPLFFIRIPQPAALADASGRFFQTVFADVRSGLRYVLAWPGLTMVLMLAALVNLLLSPTATLLPLLVTDHFNGGVWQLGWMQSSAGVGVVIGGLVLGAWGGTQRKIYTTLIGVIGIAIGTLIVSISPSEWFVMGMAGIFLTGFMNPVANGPLFAVLQSKVAPEMQGRVFTLVSSISSAMVPLSMILAGPLAEALGILAWYWISGIGCLIIGAGAFWIPRLVKIEEQVEPRFAMTD